MPHLESEFTRVRRLLSRACDNALTTDQKRELEQLMATHRERLFGEYFDFLTIDSLLRDPGTLRRIRQRLGNLPSAAQDSRGMQDASRPAESGAVLESDCNATPRTSSVFQRRFAPPPWFAWAALAASLLVAWGLWETLNGTHATIIQVEQAQWSDGQARDVGLDVSDQWLELEAGVAHLLFERGAHVTLHGPARLRTTSSNRCELQYGELAVYAPDEAQGFRVDGVGYAVTDLGTSFRLIVPREGAARLHVTQGSVELDHFSSGSEQIIASGDAMSFTPGTAPVGLLGGAASYGLQGDMQFFRTHVRSLARRDFRGDRRLAIFLERAGVRLTQDQPIDVTGSGSHTRVASGKALSKGTMIDVYLIHFAPQSRRGRASGSIRFPRPVLGLITETSRLDASNTSLGAECTLRCQHPERGLELAANPNSDRVTISDDRRTLTVACRAESIDQFRVLVEARPVNEP
jgi:hypothetical protein